MLTRIRRSGWVLVAVLMLGPLAVAQEGPEATANGATLQLDKASYQPQQVITVTFTAPELDDWAWMGLIPSDAPHGKASVNDSHDVAYHYLNGKTEGSFTFEAPVKPGSWDIRLNDAAGTNDRELVWVSFTVEAGEELEPSLTLEQTEFTSHSRFTVKFTAPSDYERPWVGLLPADVAHGSTTTNDQHDLQFEYLNNRVEGEMTFRAPGPPGSYDLRLNDTGSDKEGATVSFTVTAPDDLASIEPSLALVEDRTFHSHEMIQVRFTAPIIWWYNAWAGIVPAQVEHGSAATNDQHDLGYGWIHGRTEGVLELRAPAHPGAYDVRLHDTTRSGGQEVASVAITVEIPEGGEVEPTLTLDKESYKPGETVVVAFTAPATFDYNSWVGVIPSEIEHGSTSTNDSHDVQYEYLRGRFEGQLSFKAPDKAGSWDIRLNNGHHQGDGKEHASVTFEVME